jgi:ABC-2 type transport system permease protein
VSPLRVLLRAKVRSVLNYRKSSEGGRRRFAVFALLGALVWLGIAGAAMWFCAQVVAIEPIGVVMLRRLLGLVLLFVLSILGVSNLIAAFSTFFLADDLPALVTRPVPAYALYAARWLENAIYASWMTVLFSLPFFVAVGVAMQGPPIYYATLLLVLPVLATVPTSLAVVIALVLGRVLSAQRTKQILVVFATIVFTILFVLFRRLEPERFVDPDERAPLLEVLGTIQGSEAAWLPSTWAADALWGPLSPVLGPPGHPSLLLVTAAAALFFVGGWTFRGVFAEAFSRAQDGLGRHAEGRHPGGGRTLDELVAATSARRGRGNPRAALGRKDVRVFVRDTAQWTQMLLIGALVAIYVVNFSYIRTAGESGIISATGLHFINLSLGGFVAVAICVRFAFPAISLEGRAFWIVLRSPNRMIDLLRGKWWSLAIPLVALVVVLVSVTSLWLGSGAVLTGIAALTVVPLVVGLTGLALGLGARFPRFKIDNAAKIATGFGGMVYMLSGLVILVVDVLLAVAPTLLVQQWIEHGYAPTPVRVALCVLAAAGAVVLPIAAGSIAVRSGAAHLQRAGIHA